MRIYYGSQGLDVTETAVALGDFDAIHKGHKILINRIVEYAEKEGILSLVYMFSSHPSKDFRRINTLQKRLEILESMGVDCVVIEDFTDEYKNTSCEAFTEEYIKKRLKARAVFVGFNYRFGKGASGDTDKLKKLCGDTKVVVIPCVKVDDVAVSSTAIKKMLEEGKVDIASTFMERCFSLSGKVVRGKQLGRTIGFPTANIMYPDETVVPMKGVYITQTKIGNSKYYSITNVGEKPTVMDKTCNIETAVGNFSGDIYGEEIEIEFYKFLRDIKKFDSLDSLKEQLEEDMNKAKEFFRKEDENE